MKLNGKFKKYFAEKYHKNLFLFNLTIYRADGKTEMFSISGIEKNSFKMKNEIIYPINERAEILRTVGLQHLKHFLESALNLPFDYKRICISESEGIVFLDLWEKI